MEQSKEFVVLDTNIILLDHTNILKYPNSIVVLPGTVIREIDTFKSIMGELGFQARAFTRLLNGAEFDVTQQVIYGIDYTVASFSLGLSEVRIISRVKQLDVTNDERIIDVAHSLYRNTSDSVVRFITNDGVCRIDAMSQGIPSEDFKIVEKIAFEFIKQLSVSSDVFSTLHRTPIDLVDPSYTLENYNYVFEDSTTGQTKLGVIHDRQIRIIGKETEDQLRKQDVSPIGIEQLFLSYAIQQPDIDVVVCEARAGTGKTLVALSNAIAMITRNSPYNQIIYVRASVDDVEKVEEVGFLSGNDEKFAVYFHPLYDAIDFIIRKKYKNCNKKGDDLEKYLAEQREELIERCNIQPMTGLGMRGRTFPHAIIIIDEFQNNSQPSAQKMITRSGTDSKYILIGSQRQIDNPYITKYNNALSVILNESSKPQTGIVMHAVCLKNVIRSKLADWAERIFSKDNT